MEKRRAIISVAVILSLFLLQMESTEAIKRSEVITRARTWLNPKVPYSQTKYKNGYRTDCSGYVSMAWNTGTSYTTTTLNGITTAITKDQLKSGDILLKSGHVAIFDEWVPGTNKMKYRGFEQVGGRSNGTMSWNIPYPYWNNDNSYLPRRYVNIED